jgi:hypothetical protein
MGVRIRKLGRVTPTTGNGFIAYPVLKEDQL